MLKLQPEMTEVMKINHFHAHLRKEALQTFRNKSASNKKTLKYAKLPPHLKGSLNLAYLVWRMAHTTRLLHISKES